MKNLKPIDKNPIKVFEGISSKCHGQKRGDLLSEKSNILSRYKYYAENKTNLTNVNMQEYSQKQDLKKYLLECYGDNVTLDKLKVDIKNAQEMHYKAICPYCGINSSGTFDHYLPKEDYPDFAVLSMNLIPCCEKCNSIKGERWKDNNALLFINYYYHIMTNEKYLFANLSYLESTNVPTVTYQIKKNSGIEASMFNCIISHYTKLKLCSRFEEHANDKVSELYDEINLAYEEGESLEQQKKDLERAYKVKKKRKGRNDWEVALLETIINFDEFFLKIYNK
ncbi:hypothetical protein [Peribacillus sp. R9-11]|uniref:HNH endonuclease n=1 Tax=Peribacillus sp. R9-11 TaxID=3073271 RepID=UPI00286848C2|nr:hypothetical protein [Peribacillus sp. R9-11]WMX58624.1 hypothetical protein RE409_29445 [Peribacillus sp. R9-11]